MLLYVHTGVRSCDKLHLDPGGGAQTPLGSVPGVFMLLLECCEMPVIRYFLAALAAASLAAACAASNESNPPTTTGTSATTGAGGDPSTGGAGGGLPDAGSDAPPVPTDCTTAADCAAFNDQCSSGSCINGVCAKVAANEFGSCDDSVFCTESDVCQGGVCVGGTAKFCPSLDSCHVGVCNEALQTCQNVAGNDGGLCDDENPCTYTGVCNSGLCTQGAPIDCSDFDTQCTTGACDPVNGCLAVPSNENGPCNDALYCTIQDKCTAGSCGGIPNTCAAPGDVCMIGSCNEATDTCVSVPGNDGAACNDSNSCTAGETCAAGLCVGGMPANQGVMCDDSNGCTAGTSCQNGVCTAATSEITMCIDDDSCCPAGCVADNNCLYWASGVQQNVTPATLVGWTQCFQDTYQDSNAQLSTILSQCDKPKLLMACKQQASATYTILAMAPRADVLFDCGQQNNCTHQANGVGWYYSTNWSWGFAPAGLPVARNSCDVEAGSGQLRMCWHTGGDFINGGYRCGNDTPFGPDWQRIVFEAD